MNSSPLSFRTVRKRAKRAEGVRGICCAAGEAILRLHHGQQESSAVYRRKWLPNGTGVAAQIRSKRRIHAAVSSQPLGLLRSISVPEQCDRAGNRNQEVAPREEGRIGRGEQSDLGRSCCGLGQVSADEKSRFLTG